MMWHLIALLALASGLPQSQRVRIREIDLFGTSGIDVQAVRAALPLHSGEEITADQREDVRERLTRAIQNVVGHRPTDLRMLCCDERGDITIYIGVGGANTAVFRFLPEPTGSTCLPDEAVRLYDDADTALEKAIGQGHSGEDDSSGIALSVDPIARAKQLALHEYAIANERTIQQSLEVCKNAEKRQVAAELLGYARKSKSQITSLVRASHDSDEGVRNNAVRALWVLASSSTTTASRIPAGDFITMLNSGSWSDRNKVGFLFVALTRSRNSNLLRRLRLEALQSLIEMGRWEDPSHAYPYQVLLGRIGGLNDNEIQKLVESRRIDDIIALVIRDKQVH